MFRVQGSGQKKVSGVRCQEEEGNVSGVRFQEEEGEVSPFTLRFRRDRRQVSGFRVDRIAAIKS
jgi:hypothetical protein